MPHLALGVSEPLKPVELLLGNMEVPVLHLRICHATHVSTECVRDHRARPPQRFMCFREELACVPKEQPSCHSVYVTLALSRRDTSNHFIHTLLGDWKRLLAHHLSWEDPAFTDFTSTWCNSLPVHTSLLCGCLGFSTGCCRTDRSVLKA